MVNRGQATLFVPGPACTDAALSCPAVLSADATAPTPRLLVFGAVAYASHLTRLARVTGFRPCVIDPRGRFATRERFPDPEEVVVAWPGPALDRIGAIDPETYVAVLSNDPKIDDAGHSVDAWIG